MGASSVDISAFMAVIGCPEAGVTGRPATHVEATVGTSVSIRVPKLVCVATALDSPISNSLIDLSEAAVLSGSAEMLGVTTPTGIGWGAGEPADSTRYAIALQYSFSMSTFLIFRKLVTSTTIFPIMSGICFALTPILVKILWAAMFVLL
jgi:hypothetical protein